MNTGEGHEWRPLQPDKDPDAIEYAERALAFFTPTKAAGDILWALLATATLGIATIGAVVDRIYPIVMRLYRRHR